MKRRTLALVAVLLAAPCALLFAHDTWLLPASLRTTVGKPVRLSLTSGEGFPADDFAIAASRVMRADVRLAGKSAALAAPRRTAQSLRYVWTPRSAGFATFAVVLAPKVLSLAPDKIAEYLDEIDASAALRATWRAIPAPKRWRESYSKYAKSFVLVGNPSTDSSWAAPAGLGLELVPERDPTVLTAGDTLPVLVLRHGARVAGFAVGAAHSGDTKARFFHTDSEGRARVVLPAAGLWLLNGTDLRRTAKAGLEWESDFTTLTIAVRATSRP